MLPVLLEQPRKPLIPGARKPLIPGVGHMLLCLWEISVPRPMQRHDDGMPCPGDVPEDVKTLQRETAMCLAFLARITVADDAGRVKTPAAPARVVPAEAAMHPNSTKT
jgi:hypothetical protein